MHISFREFQNKLQKFSIRKLTLAWYRYFRLFFAFLFLIVIGLGSFIWYQSLHNFQWTEDQKKVYMEKTFTETNLKQKELENLLVSLKKREGEHQERSPISRNLFTGEPVIKQ